MEDLDITEGDVVVDGMKLDSNMFHFGMEDLILCKASCSIVVAIYQGTSVAWEHESVKEFPKEDGFM